MDLSKTLNIKVMQALDVSPCMDREKKNAHKCLFVGILCFYRSKVSYPPSVCCQFIVCDIAKMLLLVLSRAVLLDAGTIMVFFHIHSTLIN